MPEQLSDPISVSDDRRDLRADCARCFALCCVVPAFSASADFAVDKSAGSPCRNLQSDFRCGIHSHLKDRGFAGCTVYDCFGAGQKVVQVTFGGQDWRSAPGVAGQMFPVFTVMRQLQELLWYLTEALTLQPARSLHDELAVALAETERLTDMSGDELLALDVAAHRDRVDALLLETSRLVRADAPGQRADHRGADLVGKNLRSADLRGADMRGAYLIGADLRRADLRWADLIGADLRAADVGGADLGSSLYLTQFQVNAARGDRTTTLPSSLSRPAHWTVAAAGKRATSGPTSKARRAGRR